MRRTQWANTKEETGGLLSQVEDLWRCRCPLTESSSLILIVDTALGRIFHFRRFRQIRRSLSPCTPGGAFVSPQTCTLRARRLQDWIRRSDQEGFNDARLSEYLALHKSMYFRQPTRDTIKTSVDSVLSSSWKISNKTHYPFRLRSVKNKIRKYSAFGSVRFLSLNIKHEPRILF
jgi:hypothetical protein